MVSEPLIPVVSCTEMTISVAEEDRCKELLGKLKEAIDRRGLMLDKLGKVMNKMVSSLATSTPLLVSGATESTPISTATNKIPAVANAAPSADATLTDQAPTRCSTMCPDHGIDMPLSDCTMAVAPTSSSTIATLEIGNTFIANIVLVKSTECSRECEVDEYASDDMEEGDAAQRGNNGVDNEGEHVEDGNMEPDKIEKQQLDNTKSLVHPSQGIQPNHMEIDSNRESEANLANSTDRSSAVAPSVNFSSNEVPSLEISMPNSGDGSRLLSNFKPKMQTDAPSSHIKQTNPFRSIGDAMEEWKERARVSADTQDHQPETEYQIDDESATEFCYEPEGEQSTSQTLGNATADQINNDLQVKQSFSEDGSHVGKVETDERTPGDDNLEVPHLQASQSRINKSENANEFEGREIQTDTSVQDLVQGEIDNTFGNVVSFKRPPADDKVVVLDDLTSDRELSTQMDLDITNEENKRAIVDWKSLELATIMAIGMCTLPPSPRWLLLREVQGKGSVEDNKKKAIYALRRLRGRSASDNVLADEIDDTLISIKAAYAERQSEGNIWGDIGGS